ncbi:hypothetical protein HEP86_36890 [Streptomyces sp. RPA4-5]|uniref:hypothetical protein n=1 Tax=Streptomyces sp. RPA4-5 TaxID=2721245 RepID=UPI00143EC6E1|nr:hypothetical protein [Streptomyces sp. RPA4-5]QIY59039.1 hypothetical protein HEP86_36890 [Streptomyces sp. RPA4-5]
MRLTVPAVVVLGVLVGVLIRGQRLRGGPAAVAVTFGFELAHSQAAPVITDTCRLIAQLIGRLHL